MFGTPTSNCQILLHTILYTHWDIHLREFRPVKFEFAFAFGGSKYSQKNKNKILFSDSFTENKRKVLRSKLISQFEHLRSRNGTT